MAPLPDRTAQRLRRGLSSVPVRWPWFAPEGRRPKAFSDPAGVQSRHPARRSGGWSECFTPSPPQEELAFASAFAHSWTLCESLGFPCFLNLNCSFMGERKCSHKLSLNHDINPTHVTLVMHLLGCDCERGAKVYA